MRARALAAPIGALKNISRDESLLWEVGLADGGSTTALGIQASILAAAERLYKGRDEETDWVLAEWRGTRTPALVFGGRRGHLS